MKDLQTALRNLLVFVAVILKTAVRNLLIVVAGVLNFVLVHTLPFVLVVVGLPLLGVFIALVHPLVEPFGATRQQVGLVGGTLYCVFVFVAGYRLLTIGEGDTAASEPTRGTDQQEQGREGFNPDAGGSSPTLLGAVGRRSVGAVRWMVHRIVTGVFTIVWRLSVAIIGLTVFVLVLAAGVQLSIAVVHPLVSPYGVTETQVSTVGLFVSLPVAATVMVTVLRRLEQAKTALVGDSSTDTERKSGPTSSSNSEIERGVEEIRASLDTIATHQSELERAAREPADREAVVRQLDRLTEEWDAVSSQADALRTFVKGANPGDSTVHADDLADEWEQLREQWYAIIPHEAVAPLPEGTDRTAVRRVAETIQHWAINRVSDRREDQRYLDSNPETTLAVLRGDVDAQQVLQGDLDIQQDGDGLHSTPQSTEFGTDRDSP